MKDLIVTVGGADVGLTPPMPFVGRKLDGGEVTLFSRLLLEIALLRCGFDVSDRRALVTDAQELIYQSNRAQADCIVVMSASAFGSRKSFNNVCGGTVRYSAGRHGNMSRELAEDICAKIDNAKKCGTAESLHTFGGAACPAVIVEMGYLTDFDEAKLMHDPDYIRNIVEYVTMGICECMGMPYIPPSLSPYLELISMNMGKRGKKIKLLQAALCAHGYTVDIDGVYGKSTSIAVKTFAINNGYAENDGITEEFIRDLFFVTPRTLPLGSKHSNVQYIQNKLIAKLYKSPASGVLDESTIDAMNEFLTETGNAQSVCESEICEEAMKFLSKVGGGRPRLF
ncbi:MAG: N-acetylmuramoyl-L-alanine amidase [Clostridiales bacterium]|nr:N-acetylmuramoyl-L-alanine amidase [Clostridiales bacterium]